MKSTLRNEIVESVSITGGGVDLQGDLTLPHRAQGLVVFAHGSGSSRKSPRNRFVAGVLNDAGLGTLLLDLLSRDEERVDNQTAHLRFDIGLLADRLLLAMRWLKEDRALDLRMGLFGSSTGAGAALVAAAKRPADVHAVVSRGGRPDLAKSALEKVRCPTLFIIGGLDHQVIELNQEASEQLNCVKLIEIVPGATHLFEEEGALEEVAHLARNWFVRFLQQE